MTSRRVPPTSLLPLPPGWEPCPPDDAGHDAGHSAVACARPTAVPRSGVRPLLALLSAPAPDPAPADLEDSDEYVDDEGRTVVYRRWSTRRAPTVVHESWSWPGVAGSPWLGATMAREDYLELSDDTEWVAELLDPDRLAAPAASV